VPGRRPEWKGERHAVKVLLSPQGRRMLRALVKRRKQPQSEVIEELIREEYGKG
jgi:hypothetical protein